MKRFLSLILVLCLCLTILPSLSMQANAATKLYWPLSTQYGITTGYTDYANHDGVDMAADKGTPVYANFSGTATFYQCYTTISGINYLTSYGNCVYLSSGDGAYWAVFAHLNAFEGFSLQIPSSQTKYQSGSTGKITIGSKTVESGDIIGYVGTTGNSSGNHLHYGLKINGSFVNPESYLDQSMSACAAANPGSSAGTTCNCSTSYAGTYCCTTSSAPLTIRSGHGTSYEAIGSIPSGATVSVTKANGTGDGNWAHVTYNGVSGYASMEYLQKSSIGSNNSTPSYTVSSSYKASSYYTALCNVKLTGNQREDIVNIALSQVGYREGSSSNDYGGSDDGYYNNYTEYNYWYNRFVNGGMPVGGEDAPWCATFVSWCAEQAKIPTSILNRSTAAGHGPDYFNVIFYSGSSTLESSEDKDSYFKGYNYVPQKGDLFFTRSWSHVGLVVEVSGTGVITVEGNTNNTGSSQGNGVYRLSRREIADLYFGVPNYTGTELNEPSITNKVYYYAEGKTATISWSAVSGNSYYWISIWKDGDLIVNQTMNQNTSYSMKNLEKGQYKIGVSANNSAGKIWGETFSFLVGKAPAKTEVTTDQDAYTAGDTITASWSAETGTTYYLLDVYKDGELIVNKSMDMNTSYTIKNAGVGEYKFTVSANNGAGNSGSSSVTVLVSPITAPVITSSKTNYKTTQKVTVSWDAVDEASSYVYYLSEYPNEYAYTTNVATGQVTTPKVTFSDLPNGRYTIFVCTVSETGKRSSQSNWLTFYVYNTDYVPVKTVMYDGHIYALFDEEASWDFAKKLCAEMGGHLATVTSAEENAYITDLIGYGSSDAYWLGASNIVSGSYKTTDEPFKWITGEPFNYTNWKTGEPSQSGSKASLEHFLEVRKTYENQWNDAANTNRKNKGFILEIDTTTFMPASTTIYGDNEYLLLDESLPWSVAQLYCESIGGHLASITSAEEDEAIFALTQQGQKDWYFIGGSKESGEWVWCDSGKKLSSGYSNWSDSSSWGNYLMKYEGSGYWIGINNFYVPGSNMERMGFVCEIDNAVFTVSYNANGGTAAPEEQRKILGENILLSNVVPVREGYSFLGWAVDSSATSADYHPGDSFSGNADITLYAVWESGCEGNNHSFTNYVSDGNATCTEDGTKTAKCDRCTARDTKAETGSKLGHSFTNYVSDGNATCTEDGTKTAKCDRCTATDTKRETGSKRGHCFLTYVSDGNATCTTDGTKTAKCDRCEETDTSIDVGSKLGHSFVNYISDGNATCFADGTKTAKCDRCTVTNTKTDTGSKLTHSYTNYSSNNDATYEADGTKTAYCDHGCGTTHTVTDEGSKLPPAKNGWISEGGKWYYYENGTKATGWKQLAGVWYFFKTDGAMVTGWYQEAGIWYYFKSSGAMATGWVLDGGVWYYFKSSGAMATGWVLDGGVWYYFKSSGAMATGWAQDAGVWYYFKSNGVMLTGWYQEAGVWYYFKSSGAMATGWVLDGGVWYYFSTSGAMVTGWLKLGGTWYYFSSSGAMATGSVKIGNKTYYFNSSGACLNP